MGQFTINELGEEDLLLGTDGGETQTRSDGAGGTTNVAITGISADSIPYTTAAGDSVKDKLDSKTETSDVLTKTNTDSYTPSTDYHPATKKYVDDSAGDPYSDADVKTKYENNLDTNAFTDDEKTKLASVETGANSYTLPEATDSILGGVKEGSRVTITAGVIEADSQTDENYTTDEKSKLVGIEANAEVNNISDANAAILTDGSETGLHTHAGVHVNLSTDDFAGILSSGDDTVQKAMDTIDNLSLGSFDGLNTDNFDDILSADDNTTQKAMETIDDYPSAESTMTNKTIDDITNTVGANHVHLPVRNTTGVQIDIGTVLTADDTQTGTDYIEVKPVTDPQTQTVIGIAHTTLTASGAGKAGLALNTGFCRNAIDTSSWSEGTILYPNTSGGFTSTKPTSGQYQACAFVTRSDATTGELLVEFTEPVFFASTTQAGYTQLVDNLTTDDDAKALTAAQGKALKDLQGNDALTTTASTLTGAVNELDSVQGNDALTTTASTLTGAVNELDSVQGNDALTTTASTLTGAVNELDAVQGNDALTTTASTLTGAVNELDAVQGNDALTTTASTLTGAVNELDAYKAELNGDITEDFSADNSIANKVQADDLVNKAGTGASTAPYGIIGVDSTATFSGARKANITVTVGSGGDYATINAALAAMSQYYPLYVSNGFTPEIELLTGFEIEEQVIVSGVDLSWIILSAVDSNVLVDRTALTVDAGASYGITLYPVFAAIKGGRFPLINNFTIDGQVTLGSSTPDDSKIGYFCIGSGSNITGIGTTGALQMSSAACYARSGGTISANTMNNSSDSYIACYALSGGTISATTMTNSSDSSIACYALSGGTISANTMTNSSDSSIACYARSGGTISANTMTNSSDTNYACFARTGIISAYTMTLSNTASSTTYLCYVADGGMVKNGDGTWTDSGSGGKCNVAAGTISASGYVNRIG